MILINRLELDGRLVFILLVLITFLISFIIQEFILTSQIIEEYFLDVLNISFAYELVEFRNKWDWLNYLLMPIIFILKFILISGWILSGTILYGYKLSFKSIYNAVLVSEFVWLIPSIILVIWFGLFDSDYSFTDVQYFRPMSLLSLFSISSLDNWLIIPLQSINIFQVLYLLVLTFILKDTLNKGFKETLTFTFPVYLSAVLSWIIFITFININLAT